MRQAAALASVASALAIAAAATGAPDRVLERAGVLGSPSPVALARGALRAIGRAARPTHGHIGTLLEAADISWPVEEVAGAKVVVPLVALAIAAAAPPPLPMLGIPTALVAFRIPELLLARAARRRTREASREVPLFLDLLAVTTSAGLAPQLAVRLAVGALSGPLGGELRAAVGRADLGRRWRDELVAAADRLALDDLRRAVALLLRTQRLGTSLADEMSRLAGDVREARRSRAAERARTAPVKMLFPLVFLILPAFLLLTVVPVLLTTVRSIG